MKKTMRILLKTLTASTILILLTTLAHAQYVVDFEGEGEVKTAYASGTVNLSGLDWNMTEALIGTDASDFKNGVRSARLRGYAGSVMTMLENKTGGLGTLSFQYRRYGTDVQVDWKVEYSINDGADWIQVGDVFTAPASDDVQTFSVVVNVTGDVRIRILRGTPSGSANRRLNIDDITLTDYAGGGNTPPVISNIVQNPASGITPATTVSVSADVTDPDGDVTYVALNWGTETGNYPNTITMAPGSGDTYTTVSNIPAQADGTTVYYRIQANDDGGATSTSPQQSYVVSSPATHLAFVNFPASGTQGTPVAPFAVEARRGDNTADPGFTGSITLSVATGPGSVGGTVTRNAVAGVATFNDITFSASGSYTLNAASAGLTGATSTAISITAAPSVISEIMPRFINGNTPSNTRLPFAFYATLGNLLPNTTYFYYNQAVTSADGPTINGAGNPILVDPSTGEFTRTTSPGFGASNARGMFTTNDGGEYSGWFILEGTGNARFAPGNEVYMRIMINDGNGGTVVANRLTTANFATVIAFSTESTATGGTAIRAESSATPKNFAFIYDNESGTGRPLFGTSIETTGVDYAAAGTYAGFYTADVFDVNGAWGGIVPNILPNGVRRVEERSLATGAIVKTDTSPNGVWGATNTVNPDGGLDDVLVLDLIAANTPVITVTPSSLSGFTYVVGGGPSDTQTYAISAENLEGSGNVAVTAPDEYEISLNGTSYSAALSLPFSGGVITGQPVTISVRLKAGLEAGTYNGRQITHSGGNAANAIVTCSGSVTYPVPVLTAEVLPMWIQGVNGSNSKRVPFAFRAEITNLLPGATYRYYNKVVIETDNPTADGAGNTIFAKQDGTFARTSSTSMGNAGEYAEFTADGTGKYSGWFMVEPTGNARFTPGNEVFMRIMLNNGNGGAAVANRLTTVAKATVINFGTQNQAGQGTAIKGMSEAAPGNMVYLYDNVEGNGRPVYGTSVETTGIDFSAAGTYAAFYTTQVQANDGYWGGIVPNILPDGIRRIEERSNSDGSLVAVHTSDDGVWGVYDTRNPFGGDETILVIDLLPGEDPLLSVSPSSLSGFTYVEGNGPSEIKTYQLSGSNLEGSGNITVTAPADYEISSDGSTFVTELQYPFSDGEISGQPVTVSVRLKAGLAAGDYNGQAIVNSGGGASNKVVTCNGNVTAGGQPGITALTLPQFVQGINGSNNSRVPYAFRATLQNLTPGATYRYYNKVVIDGDSPTADGAGNCVFVEGSADFRRTTSTSMTNPDEYGEFTADADGSFSGWFIGEPTGNARFTPGNEIYIRIMLNDGAGGAVVAHRLTSADFATVLQFGTEASATHGTAIMGISADDPRDFVALYDNTGAAGRPLYITHIENSGAGFESVTSYAPFYVNEVAAQNGNWGGIVPNLNDAGVTRIDVLGLEDGSLKTSYTADNGVWLGTDTRNPDGGLDQVLVIYLKAIGVESPANTGLTVYAYGGEITVQAVSTNAFDFTLYNIQGQQVFNRRLQGSDHYRFGLNLPAGIYVARTLSDTHQQSFKLLIR